VFGCVSWAHISDDCKKKLDAKSHACIMMGYSKESKSYRLFDPVKQKSLSDEMYGLMRSILASSC
jgi:hypothetical protein